MALPWAASTPRRPTCLGDMMTDPVGWSAPVEITELTSGMGDDDPSLTNDLLEIYWGSRRTGGMGSEDIWVATPHVAKRSVGSGAERDGAELAGHRDDDEGHR